MKSLRFQSVFDIIGPVMIGPSSSHTAGAVRIGKIVSSIFDDTPTEVEFQLFNSFAKTYRGHGTDLALVAGILGMDTDDPEIPNSLEIAHKRGIKIVWTIQKDSNAPHPNTTKITVKKCPQDHQRNWYFYRWREYSGHRTQWFCRLSQYEYTDYHHRSSRYSRYDCPRNRGPFTLWYQYRPDECYS